MTKTKIVEPHRTFWVESFETQPQLNEGGDKGPQCVETESRAAVTATLTEKCKLKPRNGKKQFAHDCISYAAQFSLPLCTNEI